MPTRAEQPWDLADSSWRVAGDSPDGVGWLHELRSRKMILSLLPTSAARDAATEP
jgi:hypothetical protein